MKETDTRMAPSVVSICVGEPLLRWLPEVRYTLDTVLAIAGYATRWVRGDALQGVDIFYGPANAGTARHITIPWSGRAFDAAADEEPTGWVLHDGLPVLGFAGEQITPPVVVDGCMRHGTDAVYAAFWSLSGARECHYPRDRVDNLSLEGSFLRTSDLAGRPWVSLWAAALRERLEAAGLPSLRFSDDKSGIALSHDVDYPEIVRGIELLRRPRLARQILSASDPFWCFDQWCELSSTLGSASTFYFMARRGSLVRYATGDPDAFYEVDSPRYRSLIAGLLERGCEIGLHASFRSSDEPGRFAEEKARIESVVGAPIAGNRQHYWRLRPTAPHDTLDALARAGFTYDSSLAFERMPGFRRGTCHPFQPWHPGRREAVDLIEIPPAWMDDHYDGRLADTGIESPETHARQLLEDVHDSGGVAVLDYHVRGMNEAFFPRWGRWLRGFLPGARPADMVGTTPGRVADAWRAHQKRLAAIGSVELETTV